MGNLGKYSIQPSPAQATAKGFSFSWGDPKIMLPITEKSGI